MLALVRALEHVSFGVVAVACLQRLWRRARPHKPAGAAAGTPHKLLQQVEQYLALLQQIEGSEGPKSVLQWKDVVEAAAPSMDVLGLQPGQATSYHDGRGSIFRFKITEGVLVNMYFTRAGVRRSGDIHDCTQFDVVIKGRTRLRMLDPHTGQELVKEYKENDFIVIPARTPHMFEFLEDNCLLEWWSDDFKAWYYKPYRTVIDKGLPLAETEHSDFSIDVKGA